MIGKGHAISRTKASIAYGWNQDKDAEVVFKEYLAGESPGEIAEEFKIIQSQHQRCTNNTLSFVLSPAIEDGKGLTPEDLGEISRRFVEKMHLQHHQAVAFVHRDKEHIHLHLYVNRISLNGEVYKDNFIGKRSQIAADNVAQDLGLRRVKDVEYEKLQELKELRQEIKGIHDRILRTRPKTLDEYIAKMKVQQVQVIPSINKNNQLQGFRFEYNGINLKGSQVHRSMSGSKLIAEISQNQSFSRLKEAPKSLLLLNRSVPLSPNIATKITKDLVKATIRKGLDIGIGGGF